MPVTFGKYLEPIFIDSMITEVLGSVWKVTKIKTLSIDWLNNLEMLCLDSKNYPIKGVSINYPSCKMFIHYGS